MRRSEWYVIKFQNDILVLETLYLLYAVIGCVRNNDGAMVWCGDLGSADGSVERGITTKDDGCKRQ